MIAHRPSRSPTIGFPVTMPPARCFPANAASTGRSSSFASRARKSSACRTPPASGETATSAVTQVRHKPLREQPVRLEMLGGHTKRVSIRRQIVDVERGEAGYAHGFEKLRNIAWGHRIACLRTPVLARVAACARFAARSVR